MSKTAIAAVLAGLAAVALVVVAATSRDMSNAGFLIAAYLAAAVILVVYTALLGQRLHSARKSAGTRDEVPRA